MSQLTLRVALGERSYPITIGRDLWQSAAYAVGARQLLVVTNTTVAPLYLESALAALARANPGAQIESLELPDGERHKTLDTWAQILDALLSHGFDRRSVVVALGGGVVGDMAGFAAASYQRGARFVQIPTTLLAQVDSSVGGKTGVNHPRGKNMIGAFHQPDAVIIDVALLESLPERELAAGLAEVIKYGLIYDAEFFAWLERNMPALLARDPAALTHAIARSCEIKAEVVALDEREGGVRAILNLGHTYGHAIEAALGYGEWLHGEAVAAGTVMAVALSQQLGWVDAGVLERTRNLIAVAGLPTEPPAGLRAADFQRYMKLDKKVQDGAVRLVLLTALGRAIITADYPAAALADQLGQLD